LKIVYSPDILVYHNHGRRSDEHIKSLRRGYAVGRGAFYCKYILRGDKDIIHFACKERISLLKGMIKRLIKGQSSTNQRLFFAAILVGFMYRLIRIKYKLNSTTKS
jgi:hypothetical protein